jgi:putative pyruvate formate lyase activating enzyme
MSNAPRAFIMDAFTPAYLNPEVRTTLPARAREAVERLKDCHVCPRACAVNRLADETGLCRTGRYAQISSAFAHLGEEQCLVGQNGSGTIFITHCNLRCVFCQNFDISQAGDGDPLPPKRVAERMLALQAQGCHNINFVTPEHVVPQMIEAIASAVERGLRVPIVYNTSAYDSLESIQALDGLVDVYMPDFKLWNPEPCDRYLGAADYGQRAREAIAEMHRQVGDLRFTPDHVACRGVLVRHLVMPGLLEETQAVCRWLGQTLSPDTFVNLMGQYRPAHRVGERDVHTRSQPAIRYGEINRRPSQKELQVARDTALQAGLWRFDT